LRPVARSKASALSSACSSTVPLVSVIGVKIPTLPAPLPAARVIPAWDVIGMNSPVASALWIVAGAINSAAAAAPTLARRRRVATDSPPFAKERRSHRT
jgi:hypothetical protein